MNTALYRRRTANINSRMRNGSSQPWSYFKQFKEKLQNYNSEIVILFVDEKISCALAHIARLPDHSFSAAKLHFLVGLRATLKMFLAWRCILTIYLTQIQHTF